MSHLIETWDEAYGRFDDYINAITEGATGKSYVTVLGMNYDAHRVLKELDPIAYRCEFNDWADATEIDIDSLIGPDRMD